MRRRPLAWIVGLIAALLLGSAVAQETDDQLTIGEALAADENFSVLTSLLEQAGLLETLQGAGPFTLFAPANGVFENLDAAVLDRISGDEALLERVLSSHVLEGTYGVNDLQDAEPGSLVTLEGEPLEVALGVGGLTVDGANLDSTDVEIQYINGVVHVVGDLVVPATLAADLGLATDAAQADATADTAEGADAADAAADTTAQASDETLVTVLTNDGRFGTLLTALEQAGLVEALQGAGPFTVFAPTDEAFAALPQEQLDALLADSEALQRVLSYHVVEGEVLSGDLQAGGVTTLEGEDVQVDLANGVMIDEATVTEADLVASNGVVHVIDGVLLPGDILGQ